MKKFIVPLSLLCLTLTGCGGGNNDDGGDGTKISVDPLSAAEVGIAEANLPDKANINQLSGEINIALDFEGRDVGWKAAAKEYERLQGVDKNGKNNVTINIKVDTAGDEYGTKLNQMLIDVANGQVGEWDIVEGNLGYGNTRKACVDIHSFIKDPNPYCGKGNESWVDVLEPEAYKNYESDTGWGSHYILNTENMQSAWFVNKVALDATKTVTFTDVNGETQNGYMNEKKVLGGYPITWDDLINLCKAMQAAGYTNPLGISFSASSIKSLQFTWLLRIYGDYYYRQFYKYTMGEGENVWSYYDETERCPELATGFGFKHSKVLNLLFDVSNSTGFGPGYVGYKSEVYKDFVSNLYKMKGLLIRDAEKTEFGELRNQFMLQSNEKSSAQICLDYLGQGLQYMNYENDKFKLGYFDYPQMKSGTFTKDSDPCTYPHQAGQKIVSDNTITRDIGGNGGFVSVVNQTSDKNRTKIAKDFLKFFLSPYGQSIYYKALNESTGHISPKGLTTVDNELVNIPQSWKTFFASAKSEGIRFNGNVDPDLFLSYGVRYFNGFQKTETAIVTNWRKLIVTNEKYDIDSFANDWHTACMYDLVDMSNDSEHGWDPEMYKHPIDGRY